MGGLVMCAKMFDLPPLTLINLMVSNAIKSDKWENISMGLLFEISLADLLTYKGAQFLH